MLIEQLTLTNILSFGPEPETVTFGPLTVLIGANGSGKSNILEVIDLPRNAPGDLLKLVREGGGVREWPWKGKTGGVPFLSVDAIIRPSVVFPAPKIRYDVIVGFIPFHAVIIGETIEEVRDGTEQDKPRVYYHRGDGTWNFKDDGTTQYAGPGSVDTARSILAQLRDIEHHPEITTLAGDLGRIQLYREWRFGREAPSRQIQRADLPNRWLDPDTGNLAHVMKQLADDPEARTRFLDALRECHGGIDDFGVEEIGDFIQPFIQEGPYKIPAIRLSDGTLRYLCLLAILCHPNPPPLVCIEEPELGLHPDIIRTVAKLLKEASERCQLIVTTHSEVLVDAMTDMPEAVVVCEKPDGATKLRRLSQSDLEPWLERYSLGQLWSRGDIGGNRW